MTQFYSRIDTEFNGDVYSIPFSYSKQSEISVYIDDKVFNDWQFLNESQIQLTKIPTEINTNSIVSIRRNTNISEKIVEYTNNTMLSKDALNLSQDQLLNAVQEVYDNNIQFNLDTLDLIAQNKSEIEAEFDAFTDDINATIEQVTEAAEKLDALDAAVAEATAQAELATAQAELATQKAEETVNTLNEATTSMNQKLANAQQAAEDAVNAINNAADKSLSNLTVEGEQKIKNAGLLPFAISSGALDSNGKPHLGYTDSLPYEVTAEVPTYASAAEAEAGKNGVKISPLSAYAIIGVSSPLINAFSGSSVDLIFDNPTRLTHIRYDGGGQTNNTWSYALGSISASNDGVEWTTVWSGGSSYTNVEQDITMEGQYTTYRYNFTPPSGYQTIGGARACMAGLINATYIAEQVQGSNYLYFNTPVTFKSASGAMYTLNSIAPLDISALADGRHQVMLTPRGAEIVEGVYTQMHTPDKPFVNIASAANAISGGSYKADTYPISNAFDGNTTTKCMMYNAGTSISGVCYFGLQNLSKPVRKIRVYQGYDSPSYPTGHSVSSVKIQYSNNGTDWIDIQTAALNDGAYTDIDITSYTPSGDNHALRLLANSGVIINNTSAWAINEFEAYVESSAKSIWYNGSEAFYLQNGTWISGYEGVRACEVTVVGGVITDVYNYPYRDNGMPYNLVSIANLLVPDYTAGVNKAVNVVHTATAPGLLYLHGAGQSGSNNYVSINGTQMSYQGDSGAYAYAATALPVAKGDVYKVWGSGAVCTYYPMRGVN